MKILLSFNLLLGLLILVGLVASTAASQPSNDAVAITLRIQQGVRLDTGLAAAVDSGLVAARRTYDTLSTIHAAERYVPDELVVMTNSTWSDAWRRGELRTGEKYIDSLDEQYGLIRVDTGMHAFQPFILTFEHPLQMQRLGALYHLQHGVQFAEPNGYGGDGDDIFFFRKNDTMYFVFSRGWGDCPSGCMWRFYWYVVVTRNNGNLVASMVEQRGSYESRQYCYRWNIPSVYAMTMFPDADSILHTISSSAAWWVRRHAIEGTLRFFNQTSPWTDDNPAQWELLRTELRGRRADVLSTLRSVMLDPDSDVSASARHAVSIILATSISQRSEMSPRFILEQNYPNPFNPSTSIRYELPVDSRVSVKVFNVLGQQVAELANGIQSAGYKTVSLDASRFSSGIYFYHLDAVATGDPSRTFTQVRKMILLK